MSTLADVAAFRETSGAALDFAALVRCVAAGRGDPQLALAVAEGNARASPRVVSVLRQVVNGGSLTDPSWSALSDAGSIISGFLGSLRSAGAFDRMLTSMRRLPVNTRILIVTAGATGGISAEGSARPITSLSLDSDVLLPIEAVASVVVTRELAVSGGGVAADLFGSELRSAIAAVTDSEFLRRITAGLSPIDSHGGTSVAILQDIASALADIDTDASSRLFVIVEPATAKAWASKTTSTGEIAFPSMTPQGGVICGMPVVVSDGLSANTFAIIDASAVGADAGTVLLDASGQADVQMSTAPDSPVTASTVLSSLWQLNLVGLRATRTFAAELLRSTGAAVVQGLNYSGNSPA